MAPGPSKTLEMFGADQAACQQNAAAQLSPAVAAANNQAVGGALLGGALGAGLGAGIGAAAANAGKCPTRFDITGEHGLPCDSSFS